MELLFSLLVLAGIIYLVHRLTRGGGFRRRGRGFKCRDCRFQRKLFDDGVMCGYGDVEVFKNPRHIAMCPDWAPQLKGRR